MNLLQKFDFTPQQILKFAGLAFVALLILSFVIRVAGPVMQESVWQYAAETDGAMTAPGSPKYYGEDYAEEAGYAANDAIGLSIRNIAPVPSPEPPHDGGYTSGNDAEDFEITSYSASIETRNLEQTCGTVSALKSEEHVIFENTNEYDQGCDYTFKVETARVDEVLVVVEELHPKDFSTNTQTIKRLVEDYTSQEDILKNKLASIDETLTNAVTAYDEITTLATRTQDVESLTNIINSKVQIIERLTQERIAITAQLERIGRSKAEQLDRLEYTYFSVHIYEQVFIDGEALRDSWKYATKQAIRDINAVAQDMSIGLVSLLFFGIQYGIYFFILLIVVKYGWKFTQYIWRK